MIRFPLDSRAEATSASATAAADTGLYFSGIRKASRSRDLLAKPELGALPEKQRWPNNGMASEWKSEDRCLQLSTRL